MLIHSGVFSKMVLQRDRTDRCDVPIAGQADHDGSVLVRVTHQGKPLPGFANRRIGQVRNGKLTARLRGLPAGGPYRLELSIASAEERLVIDDLLVGDLWIAGGQSNMQGCGARGDRAKPHPMVRAFYMDDVWRIARDPIHNLWDSIDPVHAEIAGGNRPLQNPLCGTGSAVAFAQEMHRRTGVPQGILACAHGGTTMTQWDPRRRKLAGRSLYGATMRRVTKNGGRVAGVIWYQGESDANLKNAALYTSRMKALVRAFRRDLRQPRLPWAMVQIGRVISDTYGPSWNQIQEQQRLLPRAIPDLATVASIDLRLQDGIHISGRDQQTLGRRLAAAMMVLREGRRAGQPPIAFRRVHMVADPRRGGLANLIVEFDHVQGQLVCGGRPLGFSTGNPQPYPLILDSQLDGARVILKTVKPAAALNGFVLYYGRGSDPTCNVLDQGGRALPVMGPIPIGRPRAHLPFVRQFQVTPVLPLPKGVNNELRNLTYPRIADLPLTPRQFPAAFCDMHEEIAQAIGREALVWFVYRFRCAQPMKLAACIGYDGPVKLFIDGREVLHDPKGNNPAIEDRAVIPFRGKPGVHELAVALSTNRGRAWGLFLRLERLDVTAKQIRQTPWPFAMPEPVE